MGPLTCFGLGRFRSLPSILDVMRIDAGSPCVRRGVTTLAQASPRRISGAMMRSLVV
jgi:hypothetical protein